MVTSPNRNAFICCSSKHQGDHRGLHDLPPRSAHLGLLAETGQSRLQTAMTGHARDGAPIAVLDGALNRADPWRQNVPRPSGSKSAFWSWMKSVGVACLFCLPVGDALSARLSNPLHVEPKWLRPLSLLPLPTRRLVRRNTSNVSRKLNPATREIELRAKRHSGNASGARNRKKECVQSGWVPTREFVSLECIATCAFRSTCSYA